MKELALLGLACLGCTGVIDGTESSRRGGSEPSTGNTVDDPAEPGACVAQAPLEARLLSARQYDHTVQQLLGIESGALAVLNERGGVTFGLVKLDEVGVERFAEAAEAVAALAVAALPQVFPCATTALPDDPCVSDWIGKLGERAYRRPLTELERSELGALFGAGVSEGGAAKGVEWLVGGILQAPDFLYRLALDPPGSAAAVRALSGHELASRLSYTLWESMPDDALFTAASAGTLSTPEGLRSEAERLLAHPNFQRSLQTFYEHWLKLGVFAEVARDAPDFNQAVIESLRRSVQVGLQNLYAGPQPNVADLLLGSTYYLDGVLAGFYGVATPDPESFVAFDLGHEGRRGIMAHPALMTALARPDQAFPIGRGLFVLEALLCQELAPPQGDIPPLPAIPAGGSERDQLVQHSQNPTCAACHSLIDPFGFAFQDFDEVGRFRSGMDSSGSISGLGAGIDGSFAAGSELMERLGQSALVRECLAEHFFEYGLSRYVLPSDGCSLEPITTSFVETGDLRQLLLDVVLSHAFRHHFSDVNAP
jgi:hypothetical protein